MNSEQAAKASNALVATVDYYAATTAELLKDKAAAEEVIKRLSVQMKSQAEQLQRLTHERDTLTAVVEAWVRLVGEYLDGKPLEGRADLRRLKAAHDRATAEAQAAGPEPEATPDGQPAAGAQAEEQERVC